jgi:hypothetical protein
MVQSHHNLMALHKDLPSVALLGHVCQTYEKGIQLVRRSSYKVHVTLRYLLLFNHFQSILTQHNGTVYNLKKPLKFASVKCKPEDEIHAVTCDILRREHKPIFLERHMTVPSICLHTQMLQNYDQNSTGARLFYTHKM